MRAGAAFVPLDLAHPAERLLYMLDNSQADCLLTERAQQTVLAGNLSVLTERIPVGI